MNRCSTLGDMKPFHVISFLCGAGVMLGFSTLRGSDPSHHTYELRLYHVHSGKIDTQSALRRSHRRDFQTAQHEEHRLLGAGRCAKFAKPFHLHSGASKPSKSGGELGRLPSRSGMEKGEDRIGSKRAASGSDRSVIHGPDWLFGVELVECQKWK